MRGLFKVKRKLIASIREKELQLAKLKVHIDKSEVCSDLYNKMLLEKAILKKQLAILKMACYNCIALTLGRYDLRRKEDTSI